MTRRLSLIVLALAALLALSGCDRLCKAGAVTWCPRVDGDQLNRAPVAEIGVHPTPRSPLEQVSAERSVHPVNERVRFFARAQDPDGDSLLLEWDLDQDGEFERAGRAVSRSYPRPATVTVRLRVSDFPRRLGAPEQTIATATVVVVDPAANRPPVARVSVTPEHPGVGDEVVFDASGASDPDAHDQPPASLVHIWNISGAGDQARGNTSAARVRFSTPGTKHYVLTVFDGLGQRDRVEGDIEIRPCAGVRPPVARLTARPNPAGIGRAIALDVTGSSAGDCPIGLYEWDTTGDGQTDRRSFSAVDVPPFVRQTPGQYPIRVRLTDAAGLTDEATVVVTVLETAPENAPPIPRFTATPAAPLVGQAVRLDASASSDAEGPITRYQWDLDGDGFFERDGGGEPTFTTSYETPGERLVGLRVTDADGAIATVVRALNVRRPGLALARAAGPPLGSAARARTRPLQFSARLTGRAAGRPRRRVLGRGTLRALLAERAGPSSRAERTLRRFLDAPWRTRVSAARDRRTKSLRVTALALARPRGDRRSAACLRVRIAVRRGRQPSVRFALLGGSGSAARLRVRGTARFRLERNGSATLLGRLRAARGARRALPARCRRLAA